MRTDFSFDCKHCGEKVLVNSSDAGRAVDCQKCHSQIFVPPLSRLRLIDGDKAPYQRSIDKLRKAVELRHPPFDGCCHGCGDHAANLEADVLLTIVEGRDAPSENLGSFVFVPLAGWRSIGRLFKDKSRIETTISFPLQLCQSCHRKFIFRSKLGRLIDVISLIFLGILFYSGGIMGRLMWIPVILVFIFMIRISNHNARKFGSLNTFVNRIPILRAVTEEESEFYFSTGNFNNI